jgi:hypothetical protein
MSDVPAVFPKNMKLAGDLFQREDAIVLIGRRDQTAALLFCRVHASAIRQLECSRELAVRADDRSIDIIECYDNNVLLD